jgi:hypothetical protein
MRPYENKNGHLERDKTDSTNDIQVHLRPRHGTGRGGVVRSSSRQRYSMSEPVVCEGLVIEIRQR